MTQQEKLAQAYAAGRSQAARLVNKVGDAGGLFYLHDGARCLAAVIGCPTDDVVARVVAFHRERLNAVPDLTVYPELRGYRDIILETERGLLEGGLGEAEIALQKSLAFWRSTRLLQETGRAYYARPEPEKCRIVYMADSDRGPLHVKNVDNPLTYWNPEAPIPPGTPWPYSAPLWFDGVGSNLHIDEIPPEIFPVNVMELAGEHCATVPEATDFLVKYNYFWSSQNMLVHDAAGNSMAFEKTRCRIVTRPANAQGINYITGMGALDPELAGFHRAQRQQYLDQQGWGWDDSPDGCFFQQCEGKWANMARYVDELSQSPTYDNVKSLMEQRDPSGPMCLTGVRSHPDDNQPGCTLVMRLFTIDQKLQHKRQWRGDRPAYLDTPEIIQYS